MLALIIASFFRFPLDSKMCYSACAWFLIRNVSISLSPSLLLQDKASFFLSCTVLLRGENSCWGGDDDACKSNHIGWSIIKTTLSTFVSFLSMLYEKYTKCSEKVKWIDSSVRMAYALLYHINRTILLSFSLIFLLKNNGNGLAYDSFEYSFSILFRVR